MVWRACSRDSNRRALRHFAAKEPLKHLMSTFWTGLPGPIRMGWLNTGSVQTTHERPASQSRCVIRTDLFEVAPKGNEPVEPASAIVPAHTKFFMRSARSYLKSPAPQRPLMRGSTGPDRPGPGNSVDDRVHAPGWMDCDRHHQPRRHIKKQWRLEI